jgi:hypothetical protein
MPRDPLPDIGEWKLFDRDRIGTQFQYRNPRYEAYICESRYWTWEDERQVKKSRWTICVRGFFTIGKNGHVRYFKTPEGAIRALEAEHEAMG